MRLQRSRSIWIAAGVAGLMALVHLVWFFSHPDDTAREFFTAFYTPFISTLSGLMLLFAGWRQRKTDRRGAVAWSIFGLAQLLTAAGDITWYVMEFIAYEPPSPSLGDVFYLLNYPVFLLGVLLLVPPRGWSRQWLKTSIDMAIVMLSVVLILWNYLLGPIVIQNTDSILLLALTMAYPVGDLLLIWALLELLYRNEPTANTRYLGLLGVGMCLFIIYDFIFLNQTVEGISLSGNWADLIYTVAFVIIGLAGWYQANAQNEARSTQIVVSQGSRPSMHGMSEQQTGWKVFLPYVWLALAYTMVIVRDPATSAMSPMVISSFVGVIIALILARQILTIRENRQLNTKLFSSLTQVQRQTELLENANREMEAEIKERLRVENRLAHDALHDHLTGLPNRALFIDRLARAGRMKKRHADFGYAVLFLDLDSFKLVNDSLGHVTGDQLLVYTAHTLMDCVRASDTVARLGGDEFVILLEDINTGDAERTAERLQSELARPVQLNTNRVFVTVSIGIVQNIDGYEFPEEVLRDADLAMYHAKAHGKARYEIFQEGMRASVITRLALENDLRRALEKKEFVLYYQPILSLPGQHLVGFEALVRWNHPDRGLVPPMDFIPVAEETGLILPLGEWILHEACQYARRWIKLYPAMSEVKVSVNISGKQLKQPDFIETVRWALNDTGLPASNLALEVTESVCLDSLDTVANTLLALQALGVETQIDDFGTGYSSLSYLQRLPVKSIKIDRSFTQTINNDHESTPDLVRAIFSMVNNLGIKAVAEGIETQVQLEELNRLNCAYVQGFFLALPMNETALEEWMVTSYSLPKPGDEIHPMRGKVKQVKD